jgi:putative PIN family toxin of toxin-antitoxin system
MSPPVYLVDTNVVVSGLISRDPGSPPCLVLDAMIDGALAFVLSTDLLSEYRGVLLRPRIRRRHGLGPRKVDALLTEIVTSAMMREPPSHPGGGDAHVHALLETAPGAILVTGDTELLEAVEGAITPADLAERLWPSGAP